MSSLLLLLLLLIRMFARDLWRHRPLLIATSKSPTGFLTRFVFTHRPARIFAPQVGPVSMQFEIPMYNVSNLQVRYLKIAEFAKSYNPFR